MRSEPDKGTTPLAIGLAGRDWPAAQYLRVSSAEPHQTLAYQRHLIAAFCAAQGYRLVRTYCDEGRSGLTVKGREGLKALLADVLDDPPFRTIVIADVSRWGRFQDPDEAGHYEFLCRAAGQRILYCASPGGEDDQGSAAAYLIKSVRRHLAAEFSRERSARTRLGRRRLFEAGGWGGGPAPFGFRRIVTHPATGQIVHLEPKARNPWSGAVVRLVWGPPGEVAMIRRLFSLYLDQGLTPPGIARHLEEVGLVRRPGRAWTARQVRAVLTNDLVIGRMVGGRSRYHLGERTRIEDPANWRRQTIFTPMITPTRFEAAQQRLACRSRHYADAELLTDLKRLLDRHGDLDRARVQAEGRYRVSLYVRRFGSLQAAFRQVGFERRLRDRQHVETLTPEAIKARVERLLAETGYLSARLISTRGDVPSANVLRQTFGSLDALYEAVGFPSDRSEQLRRAWLRRRASGRSQTPSQNTGR